MSQTIKFSPEFLYQYVSFYPCPLLCCLPFTDTYKQSVGKIALVFTFVCIPISAIPAALYAFPGIGSAAALVTIRDKTQRLGRMIDSMARLSASDETGKNREPTDFSALLRENTEKFRYILKQQGNILTVQISSDMPETFIETDKLAQAVSNLMTNAAEHTKNGQVAVSADFDGEYITVCISDTGGGVPPDILPKIFKRGVSGRGSTGCGLYICKTVAEAHGGTIGIESKPGQGTTLTFTVPVCGDREAGHSL